MVKDNMWIEEAVRLYFEGYTAKEAILTAAKYKEEERIQDDRQLLYDDEKNITI